MNRVSVLPIIFAIVFAGNLVAIIERINASESIPTEVVQLSIRNGELEIPLDVIKVIQGTKLILIIATNKPLTLHLHGYDIVHTIIPENPHAMEIQTFATGRYPIKVHSHVDAQQDGTDHEQTLVYLEVHPE